MAHGFGGFTDGQGLLIHATIICRGSLVRSRNAFQVSKCPQKLPLPASKSHPPSATHGNGLPPTHPTNPSPTRQNHPESPAFKSSEAPSSAKIWTTSPSPCSAAFMMAVLRARFPFGRQKRQKYKPKKNLDQISLFPIKHFRFSHRVPLVQDMRTATHEKRFKGNATLRKTRAHPSGMGRKNATLRNRPEQLWPCQGSVTQGLVGQDKSNC